MPEAPASLSRKASPCADTLPLLAPRPTRSFPPTSTLDLEPGPIPFPSRHKAPPTSPLDHSGPTPPAGEVSTRLPHSTPRGVHPSSSKRTASAGTPFDRIVGGTLPTQLAPFRRTSASAEAVGSVSRGIAEVLGGARGSRLDGSLVSQPVETYPASESGASVLSAFGPSPSRNHASSSKRLETDSPLRTCVNWMEKRGREAWMVPLAVAVAVLLKAAVGLGSYSGAATPPLRGDFEAQRQWLALTTSSVSSPVLYQASSETVLSHEWYSHNLAYWGLDYPPVTAYHSLVLGALARLSSASAPYVALRPPFSSNSTLSSALWEASMSQLERDGAMKGWMRGTVIWGDLLLWIGAVTVYCRTNYARGKNSKSTAVAVATILLQPALILIDSGHFQYNSIMLGLTLWSLNLFQRGLDLWGAVAFVLSLGFKQMALYYSPAVFAYLLGKCLWLGGRPGVSLLLSIGVVTLSAFAVVFAPFLYPPSLLLQVVHRIFPFARGLFEDKVANVWCALNVAVKLRDLASVGVLARMALFATVCAVLPSVVGVLWVANEAGRRDRATTKDPPPPASKPSPTFVLLPHALFLSAMAFFLFSFQVHEKSILLPLMPLTVLMGAREAGFGRLDWEWAVLLNNIGVFSMWPLLRRDGLGLQYVVLAAAWNFAIGYNPAALRPSFVKYLSLISYSLVAVLHALEVVAAPPAHLPDVFAVLNLTLSAGVFGIGFLWATKRATQEGWAVIML